MFDAVKDYLVPKRFGVVAYVCLIVHFLCGLTFTAVTSALRASETGKFSCDVDVKSATVDVEKTCYSRYEKTYESPLPLYGFVLLSFGSSVLISVIYSLGVSARVEAVERTLNTNDSEEASHRFYVFYFYFLHLILRSLLAILSTVLQHLFFYPDGFVIEFNCNPSTPDVDNRIGNYITRSRDKSDNISISCENPTASEKQLWSVAVSVLNSAFALITLSEVVYLIRQKFCTSNPGWSCDNEFITTYLLHTQYVPLADDLPITTENTTSSTNYIGCYKEQVLKRLRPHDICYAKDTDLDHMYIDLIINTERARHNFSDKNKRHEIFDVYMKVPRTSIRLQEIKDLFHPNKDTMESCPRTILAVGRPGIGKTVLTEKIIRDWAKEIDEFYTNKVAVYLKFRWFNFEEFKMLSLKMFLRYGTGLGEEEFETIFDTIISEPERLLLIFDGLDEFSGNFERCFDESRIFSNNPDTSMPGMTLFIKLVSGNMLDGTTVLVTTRPTADNFYSKMRFDRRVEILGFTQDKIKEYVIRFCQNAGKEEFQLEILNYIQSSSDLLNLCYIPVNCYIVCATLSGCLDNVTADDTDPFPTTLTELYRTAVNHFEKNHDRISDEKTTTGLQKLAFDGMEKGQLVFNALDFNDSMKDSSLVNSSSNPFYSGQSQYCFIHLTIQEFLAARYVTETLNSKEIAQFISSHIKEGKWHLVVQFIAGLLSKKLSDTNFHDCVFALTKAVTLYDGVFYLMYHNNILVTKWLREVNDKKIIIKACEETELNLVTTIEMKSASEISVGDWKAVVFVFQHLKKLKQINLYGFFPTTHFLHALSKLLKQHCLEKLYLYNAWLLDPGSINQVVNALSISKCQLNHDHSKLTDFVTVFHFDDECMSSLCALIKNGHACHLQRLNLVFGQISLCGISQLYKVLTEVPCYELTCLELTTTSNKMSNEEVRMLCDALIRGHHNLEKLVLRSFIPATENMSYLNEILCDERGKLRELVMKFEGKIGDEGVYKLCTGALVQERCKLTCLDLTSCSLTVNCIFDVCNALIDNHCKLSELGFTDSNIGNDGVKVLCTNALTQKQCKLTKLKLDKCGLTDDCVRCLYDTLKNGNCHLVFLSLLNNHFSQDNRKRLRDINDTEIKL